MKRILIPFVAILAPALATAAPSQLEQNVSRDLPAYVDNVDVSQLSPHQLGVIYQLIHSNRTENDKRLLIRSALGGVHSLRGVFFGTK